MKVKNKRRTIIAKGRNKFSTIEKYVQSTANYHITLEGTDNAVIYNNFSVYPRVGYYTQPKLKLQLQLSTY